MTHPLPQPDDTPGAAALQPTPLLGDIIGRDQFISGDQVLGDTIIVHEIRESTGVAIGAGAQSIVNHINNVVNHITQQALSTVDEADKARTQALRILAENVRSYAQNLTELANQKGTLQEGGPYRGLIAYTLADAELFFGRRHAITELLAQMATTRLTVLQSESGAGKSSLLRAGIAPQLILNGHLPLILRPYNLSPSLKIKQVFLAGLEIYSEFQNAPLRTFLYQVTQVLGNSTKLYILLDQFEEFFTFLPRNTPAATELPSTAFVNELADCLEDPGLNVCWVLALRSEFFGELATFRPRLQNPFANDYRLNRLTLTEAEAVIAEPAAYYGIVVEQTLVAAILADLQQADGQIAPPQIQLVCQALYQVFKTAQAQDATLPNLITLAMYEREGRAQGILRRYLNRALGRTFHTSEQQEFARRLLIELVSSDHRRLRLSRSALAKRLTTSLPTPQNLNATLRDLVSTHLLIVDQGDDGAEATYELAHDYLLGEIQFDPAVQAQKAAQELLQQEVEAYQRFSTLLSKEKFAIINSQRPLLVIDDKAERLLSQSEVTIRQEENSKLRQAQTLAAEQANRARTFRWALIITTTLLLIAIIIGYIAYDRQQAAEQSARLAQSRALAANAQAAGDTQPMRALILAIEAGQRAPTDQAFTAIKQRMFKMLKPSLVLPHTTLVIDAHWNKDQSRIITWSQDQTARVWDGAKGTLLLTLAHDDHIGDGRLYDDYTGDAQWNPAETRILTWGGNHKVRIWDATTGEQLLLFVRRDIAGADWSHDGSHILTWGQDSTASVWDATSGGEAIFTLPHNDVVTDAHWNADDTRILTGSRDHTAKVWDTASGELILTLPHNDAVMGAHWNADGTRILTWSLDNTTRLWNGVSGKLLHTLTHDDDVNEARWSSNETLILTLTPNGITHLWDVVTGEMIREIRCGGTVFGAQWSTDESHVLTWGAIASLGSAWICDADSGTLLSIMSEPTAIYGAQWAAEANRILTWSRDHTVRMWNVIRGEPLDSLGHGTPVWGARWNKPEDRMLTWGAGSSANVWNTANGQQILTLAHNSAVYAAQWNHNESRILTWSGDHTARLWDAVTGQPLLTLSHDDSVWGAQWSDDESRILSWSWDNTARVWDSATGQQLRVLKHGGDVWGAHWNKDASRILSWSADQNANIWDAASGERLLILPQDESLMAEVSGARWNGDESRILTWSGDLSSRRGEARVWDAESGQLLITLAHDAFVAGALWNGDESLILTWSYDETARVWEATSGKLLHTFAHSSSVWGAQWNRGESRILTWSWDGTARIWNAQNGQLLLEFSHDMPIKGASWNTDETKIITWSDDATARLWDADTGSLLQTLAGDGFRITTVQWNHDSSQVMLTTEGGHIFRYYTRMDDLLTTACTLATRNLTWFEWQQYLPGEPYRQTCPNLPIHPSVPASALAPSATSSP